MSATSVAAERDWLPRVNHCGAESRQLPSIQVNGRELRDISAEALEAVVASNNPAKLFCRGASVARVDQAEDGRPIITSVTDIHLRGEMTRAADFYKLTKSGKDLVRIALSPPLDAARDILSRPVSELGFPPLDAIAEAPFIRPDGAVVSRPGYDAATRTYYAPTGTMVDFDVPERPTADDIDAARALIEDALGEFPFVDQASKANAFALFITPEIRPAIVGNVPIALADAPQAGCGKTLLVSVVSEKNSGSAAALQPAPIRNDEEWRKILTATIQAGHRLTIFDNVDHVLNSPNLALAVTASRWTDRILGRTELVTLPQRTVFVVTGNNLILGGDLPRRCYWIRLDAQCSEPWRNRSFRHPDLRGWVRQNRGRLLGASLTLARAWFVAGCPLASTPMLGSFEEWCRTAGGILHVAGISGFLENLDELYQHSDPTLTAWEAFLIGLLKVMPRSGFKCADLVARIGENNELRSLLPEDLGKIDEGFGRRLGKAFLKRVGRRYGTWGIHLVRFGDNKGTAVWGIRADREEGIQ